MTFTRHHLALPVAARRSATATRLAVAAGALMILAHAGCKPAVDIAEPSPFDEDDLRAQPDGVADGVADDDPGDDADRALDLLPRDPGPRGLRRSTVARSNLQAVLDGGPGGFLRGVEVAPQFRDGRFSGWRIVQFMPGEMRFDPYDLRPGDIIGPINGRLIERPPHLASLWDELRTASSIVVEVQRDGRRFELRFDVSESVEPASPETTPGSSRIPGDGELGSIAPAE